MSNCYWPGLYHDYDPEELPCTNNDVECLLRGTQRTSPDPAVWPMTSGAKWPLLADWGYPILDVGVRSLWLAVVIIHYMEVAI